MVTAGKDIEIFYFVGVNAKDSGREGIQYFIYQGCFANLSSTIEDEYLIRGGQLVLYGGKECSSYIHDLQLSMNSAGS